MWMVSYRKGAEGKTKEKRRNSTEYTPGQNFELKVNVLNLSKEVRAT